MRPDDRPLRRLPTLAHDKAALETCVFCPKLCRSACPVSNADERETVTPWGKMSMAYFLARGDVPLEASYAAPAWACTGCYACRESCDHRNAVAPVLFRARAALADRGLAPEGAKRAIAQFEAQGTQTREAVRALAARAAVKTDARDALLVGCTYVRNAKPEAEHAIHATTALVRGPVALVEACCGLSLLLAGDTSGFAWHAEQFARETKHAERILVADAGCAMTLRTRYPEAGVKLDARVELLVELAAREIDSLRSVGNAEGSAAPGEPVRYHDPCQLGRGLGIYDAPRAVLARALGRAPAEFDAHHAGGACSGGGGLLPMTMPRVARDIAKRRALEHARGGGGRIVTACASSLLALRRTRTQVDDLVTWIARAARPWRAIG